MGKSPFTVRQGEACSGVEPYTAPEDCKSYEIERFGKVQQLPMAAFCPFCRNEFTTDNFGNLVRNTGHSRSDDYCFDLEREEVDGEIFVRCQSCGSSTRNILIMDEEDLNRLHELTSTAAPEESMVPIEGAEVAFGRIIFPMSEFKRIGRLLARGEADYAVAQVEGLRYRIKWDDLRNGVVQFRRGSEVYPGVDLILWVRCGS